jgi:hypothetical protein
MEPVSNRFGLARDLDTAGMALVAELGLARDLNTAGMAYAPCTHAHAHTRRCSCTGTQASPVVPMLMHTHTHTPTHTYAQMHTHFSKLDSGEPSCADTHAHARTHRVDMHMLIHTEAHAHARTNRVHMHVLMRTRRSTHFSRLGSGKPSCVSPSGEKMCAQTSQNSTALPVLEPIGARPCART